MQMETGYEANETQQRWFAVHTKHQHERTVATLLAGKGFEVFYPTYSAVHRWKDRRKAVELPLFPGYLFFAEGFERRLQILSTPGVFNILSFGSEPAEIPAQEIEAIRRMVQSSMRVEPHPCIAIGESVTVISGPLAGVSGILQRKKGFYHLIVSVELLGRSAAVEIDAAAVERTFGVASHFGQSIWTERAFPPSN